MVELTDRGRGVLGGTDSVAITIAPDAQPESAGPADPALFERLRRWRSEVARRQGIAAFMVFPDRTLNELAARKPVDLPELAAVSGVGPAKLGLYGQALLDLIGSPIH
jgi:ATP-dependent DNA helicase RecQ